MAKNPGRAGLTGRVRTLCLALPGSTERLSHGEPSFFAGRRAFAVMSLNHHGDGRWAVLVGTEAFVQQRLIEERPAVFFSPPYVGVKGWVGIELAKIGDGELRELIEGAWERVAPRRVVRAWRGG